MSALTPLINPHARTLLRALSFHVRLMNPRQVSLLLPSLSPREIRRELRSLLDSGFIIERAFLMHPEIYLPGPLFQGGKGLPPPDYGALSYELRKRWTLAPERSSAYLATRQTAKLFGGFSGGGNRDGVLLAALQATHDLHCTQIFLRIQQEHPALATQWLSEAVLKQLHPGEKTPDAAIVERSGKMLLAIEFGGSYRPRRLKALHETFISKAIPYQIW